VEFSIFGAAGRGRGGAQVTKKPPDPCWVGGFASA
jgi:hypothetical protein